LPDDVRVRRMFPHIVVCDTTSVHNDPANYSRFHQLAQAADADPEDDMRRRKERRRFKLKEEWGVLPQVSRIELRERKDKRIVVKWRCPAWWTSRAIDGDCIGLRAIDDDSNAQPQPNGGEHRALLQHSVAVDETAGQGEVVFTVPYRPEGQYRFVYLRKMAKDYEEKASSQPVTIAQGAEVSGEDTLYRFPLVPLNFTKLKSFIACAPVKTCAKLIVKDLKRVELECKERSSDCARIALQALLLCEDYTHNTCAPLPCPQLLVLVLTQLVHHASVWHFAAEIGRLECLALFVVALRRLYPSALGLSADAAQRYLVEALAKPNRKGSTPLDLASADAVHSGPRAQAYLRAIHDDDTESEEAGGDQAGFDQLEVRLTDLLHELALDHATKGA
jgi:hypothetical protein